METILAEIRVFAARIGGSRSILLHLAVLTAFGVWIPRAKGLDFLDPQVLGAYLCLGLLFAGPAAAQSFSEGFAPPPFSLAIARVVTGVLYGEAAVGALTGAGIATVYLSLRGQFIPQLDLPSLMKPATLGLGGAVMVAAMAAWMAVRFSRRAAMIALRFIFFALLILFYYRGQWLPEVAWTGAAVCFAVAALFIVMLRKACLQPRNRIS
ncbi:MAG TPA: hypothetical protein VMT15_16170 [Bryobacteraceae bacterium]|nr:hypothetical protein [Bryobacteraceae bacterium]